MRMPTRLQNKRILITGASSGIGEAVAREFARQGAEVVVVSERTEELNAVAQSIREAGGRAAVFVVDLSKPAQVQGLIARIEAEVGALDVLVNNAGIGLGATIMETRQDQMRLLFEVNFFALADLCRQALTVMAARRSARTVEMQDFEKAKDKILMGPERKSMVMPEEERRNTAYHESGHALLGKMLPKCDPVHKVTIIPRGRALGVTMSLPAQDRYSYDREYMLSQISMLFGGRIAEEVFMNQMTTGASNDFERATSLARDMVTRYGMTEALGPMVYAENEGEIFLGRSVTKTNNMSESTLQKVDGEVRRIIDQQYAVARTLIEDNKDKIHSMAKALLEWETLDGEQLDDIIAGKEPRPPKDWTPRNASVGGGSGPTGGTPAVNTDPAPTVA